MRVSVFILENYGAVNCNVHCRPCPVYNFTSFVYAFFHRIKFIMFHKFTFTTLILTTKT